MIDHTLIVIDRRDYHRESVMFLAIEIPETG